MERESWIGYRREWGVIAANVTATVDTLIIGTGTAQRQILTADRSRRAILTQQTIDRTNGKAVHIGIRTREAWVRFMFRV